MLDQNQATPPDVPSTGPRDLAVPLPADWGPLVDADQVASFLGWSVETIYQLADKGKLQGICSDGTLYKRRTGKRGKRGVRILTSTVRQLLAPAVEEPAPPPAPATVQPEAALPFPTPKKITKPPQAGRGRSRSRVSLPYPSKSRSARPEGSDAARRGGCSAA
jgi:hypothetical protein